MSLTKNQIVIAGVTGFVVIVLVLVFAGVIPGLKTSGPEAIAAKLTIWGVGDSAEAYAGAFAAFKTKYRNVTFDYRPFPDETTYEATLLDALAAGTGPDIFEIRNDKLYRQFNKLTPAPRTVIDLPELRAKFPQVVEQDFYGTNGIYALPLSIDTLALFWNRDMFDAAGIATPPATWDEVQSSLPSLVKKDAAGNIAQAAIALGGTPAQIDTAVDTLYLLMLQTGTAMTDANFTRATFASSEGLNALRFYTQFADPSTGSYTWEPSLGNARALFADERLAMLVDYASAVPALKTRNAYLNYGVTPIPQPKDATKSVTYPSYYGYAVSRRTPYAALAWEFIKGMTTVDTVARSYDVAVKKPPALRALVTAFANDPVQNVFARQILTARSWPQIDPDAIRATFANLIGAALTDPAHAGDALRTAAGEVTSLIERRTF